MPTYNSGTSNYPTNYDLFPTGVTTATVSYVLDQIRDSGTGIISQSGVAVVALDMNSAYTIVQRIEETLGLDPQGGFDTVVERLEYIEGVSGLSFVATSGGTMTGALVMLGASISVNTLASTGLTWMLLGNSTITSSGAVTINSTGSLTLSPSSNALNITSNSILANTVNSQIYATNLNELSGNTISLLSASGVITNRVILPSTSGNINIGSADYPFGTIYADLISSSGANGSYVKSSGGTVFGDLTLNSGVSILVAQSGSGNLGSISAPLSKIYTKTLYASFISGLSPVTFNSDLTFASGVGILFGSSGTSDIGSASSRISTLYVNTVDALTISIDGYVEKSGASMTGSLTIASGSNIVLNSGSIRPLVSGVGTIGLTGNYFENVYTNQINGRNVGNLVFNEIAAGTVNGVNKSFTLAHAPLSGYAMIFVSGLLIAPTTQYIISGTNLGLTGSMYAPLSAPVAGFYIY
jgi:hypothetical protein